MANNSKISVVYNNYIAEEEIAAISYCQQNMLDYTNFITINKGKFKILNGKFILIKGVTYKTSVKQMHAPSVLKTLTTTDDSLESIARTASLQNVTSDNDQQYVSTKLRTEIEKSGSLDLIIIKNRIEKKLNTPDKEIKSVSDMLYKER